MIKPNNSYTTLIYGFQKKKKAEGHKNRFAADMNNHNLSAQCTPRLSQCTVLIANVPFFRYCMKCIIYLGRRTKEKIQTGGKQKQKGAREKRTVVI